MTTTAKMLTTNEVAALAGVSRQSVVNACARYIVTDGRRGLPSTRHGNAYMIRASDARAWIKQTADRRASAKLAVRP